MTPRTEDGVRQELIDKLEPWVRGIRRLHKHRVFGLEHFPRQGPVVLAVNHSFASYDIILLAAAVYEETGRVVRALGDRLIFKLPGIREAALALGAVEGRPSSARDLLEAGEVVMVAPGGMREALRPSGERYEIRWGRRTGFAREALQAHAPVVLAACPRADDLYTLYPNPMTKWAYRRFRVPLPVLRGWGPTLVPRPVQLTHVLSEPILPPESESDREELEAFHGKLVQRMNRLMAEGLE